MVASRFWETPGGKLPAGGSSGNVHAGVQLLGPELAPLVARLVDLNGRLQVADGK